MGRFRPAHFTDVSQGASQWTWIFGDGDTLTYAHIQSPHVSHIYTDAPEQYELTQIVYNSAGCSDTISQTIFLHQGIVVANAFSPNGDGNNDVFRLIYRGIDHLYEFKIYNRWGELVFNASSDLEAFWDGSLNGTPQPTGVYVYHVSARTVEGEDISMSGNVNLIR